MGACYKQAVWASALLSALAKPPPLMAGNRNHVVLTLISKCHLTTANVLQYTQNFAKLI